MWPLAICSCSSWSERPSSWRRGGEEGDVLDDEEEEEEGRDEERRRETRKSGKPVDRSWRRHRAITVLEKENKEIRDNLSWPKMDDAYCLLTAR